MKNVTHRRKQPLEFAWPEIPFHVVLVEPQIPPNTGNIARLCAATGSVLHLVGPLGFRLDDRNLRRAGLDYWSSVRVERYTDIMDFYGQRTDGERFFYYSTSGSRGYTTAHYRPGDWLVFGNEPEGLPDALLDANTGRVYTIPLKRDHVRSLNLATAVSIVLYEALRQAGVGEAP